jgi:hypothetical protein
MAPSVRPNDFSTLSNRELAEISLLDFCEDHRQKEFLELLAFLGASVFDLQSHGILACGADDACGQAQRMGSGFEFQQNLDD